MLTLIVILLIILLTAIIIMGLNRNGGDFGAVLISGATLASLFIMAILYSAASWGWVLYRFWGWFVHPVFTELPDIGYIQAVGIMFVIGLFNRHTSGIKDEYVDNSKVYTALILGPWVTIALAWTVKCILM